MKRNTTLKTRIMVIAGRSGCCRYREGKDSRHVYPYSKQRVYADSGWRESTMGGALALHTFDPGLILANPYTPQSPERSNLSAEPDESPGHCQV